MARNTLVLTHYEAEMVLVPEGPNDAKLVQALRVIVFGPHFPQRAIEPELLVGDLKAHGVSITREQSAIRGYFAHPPPDGGRVRVRYGDSLEGEVSEMFSQARIRRLPRGCGKG
ncbi:MAG TPA: hypothetical protein VMU04_12370 [Candidatus Acidoferrum sp.]|nr:hypothetical protein [Candidatus Acidoferrum sp.]